MNDRDPIKTIVCFGDSNTWGYSPDGGDRFDWSVRWPGILQQRLGGEFRVIEEGLCGRTTCFDDPITPLRNGNSYLPIALETHAPVDTLIIMLGTNDLKVRIDQSAFTIAQGAAQLLSFARKFEPKIKDILLLSPPHIVASNHLEYSLSFEGAIKKSKELAQYYSYFADQNGCHFLDAATTAQCSPLDGIY